MYLKRTKFWNLQDWIKFRIFLHCLVNNQLPFDLCFLKNGCDQTKPWLVYYMESGQLITRANQLIGFCVIGKLNVNKLRPA